MNGFRQGRLFALLLSLLVPGLGHILWKELLFGLFIYLITLIAAVLFFVSFLVPFGGWVKVVMIGLPLVFYFFTFVDLFRTVQKKQGQLQVGSHKGLIFLLVALLYQALAPVAPGNFMIRNFPDYFVADSNDVSPLYSKGDYLKASRLAYTANLFFLNRPILHDLPDRFEVVRFIDESRHKRLGIVVGLPSEEIEVIEGVVVVNGAPDWDGPAGWVLNGDAPLTSVDGYSILIATMKFGVINSVHQVSVDNLIGKVSRFP